MEKSADFWNYLLVPNDVKNRINDEIFNPAGIVSMPPGELSDFVFPASKGFYREIIENVCPGNICETL